MKVLVGPSQVGLQKAIPDLAQKYPELDFACCGNRDDVPKMIVDAAVYVGPVTPEMLRAAKKLEWLQVTSTGVDRYLAIPELGASDIVLTNARGCHARCVAESAFAMILAFTRGIRESVLRQQDREWNQQGMRGALMGLTEATIGIIGFGSIGRAVAQLAQAHCMRILAVDLYPRDKPDFVGALWGLEGLEALLRQADYVVVTVPRTALSLGMIGAAQLAPMKPTALLVGVSRGGVIDQEALAQALRERRISAAALDVFQTEPLSADSELWDLPNLLITPHIAGGSQWECRRMLEILDDNLGRFLRGESPLRNQVDKEKGF